MRFGISIPNMQSGLAERLRLSTDIAFEAENLGFDSFLTTDHYMLPWTSETPETWVFLSYLAGKVSNIKLGTCVTPIPFRPPGMLAKTISTLDLVSNGRVILGVGLGWYSGEFEAYSSWDSNPVRFQKTREALELIIKLWCEKRVNFQGKYYLAKNAVLQPKPIQKPHPPLWFGGSGREMLKLTAKIGNGWITMGPRWAPHYTTAEAYTSSVEKIRKHRQDFDKKNQFTFACLIGPDESFKELVRDVENYRKAGMDYLVLGLPKVKDGEKLVRRFHNEIVNSFR